MPPGAFRAPEVPGLMYTTSRARKTHSSRVAAPEVQTPPSPSSPRKYIFRGRDLGPRPPPQDASRAYERGFGGVPVVLVEHFESYSIALTLSVG